MNVLILGGLFLLGLLAIVVAFWLVMSERGSENSPAVAAATPAAAITAPSIPFSATAAGRSPKRLTVPLQPEEAERGNTRAPLPTSQSLPVTPGGSFAPAHEAESYPGRLNGQVRELAAELRALHIRAGEMERRLSVLLEMVERIERDYGGFVEVDLDDASPDVPPSR